MIRIVLVTLDGAVVHPIIVKLAVGNNSMLAITNENGCVWLKLVMEMIRPAPERM